MIGASRARRFKPYRPVLQPELSLSGVKEDIEAAKLELTAYSATLAELINKIGTFLWSR